MLATLLSPCSTAPASALQAALDVASQARGAPDPRQRSTPGSRLCFGRWSLQVMLSMLPSRSCRVMFCFASWWFRNRQEQSTCPTIITAILHMVCSRPHTSSHASKHLDPYSPRLHLLAGSPGSPRAAVCSGRVVRCGGGPSCSPESESRSPVADAEHLEPMYVAAHVMSCR